MYMSCGTPVTLLCCDLIVIVFTYIIMPNEDMLMSPVNHFNIDCPGEMKLSLVLEYLVKIDS